jgi:hypothetical protein
MRILLLAACLIGVLSGCSTPTDKANDKATGELRHKLFVECMELSAKMPRQADDDVSDIVNACGNQSFYMANQMMK